MSFDSTLAWKRRRVAETNPFDMESTNAKLESAKQTYGREIRVFDTIKTSSSSQPGPTTEETDEFFEFTPEDYYRLLAGKKDEKFLKTKKIRDAEAMARRSKVTKAVIRVRFPDGLTLQATFHPSETLQTVFDLLNKVVARPDLSYYLYTTPPKKQINNTSQNFFDAGFVPGAIVHFSYDLPRDDDAFSGPFLREDVMSLNGLEFVQEPTKEMTEQPGSETVPSAVPSAERRSADKKVVKPKWLKM